MNRNQALQAFSEDLHISHKQIFTFLNCSLKYRFQYVENRYPEHVSIALPIGLATRASFITNALDENERMSFIQMQVGHMTTRMIVDH